jgi:hypothetical protein
MEGDVRMKILPFAFDIVIVMLILSLVVLFCVTTSHLEFNSPAMDNPQKEHDVNFTYIPHMVRFHFEPDCKGCTIIIWETDKPATPITKYSDNESNAYFFVNPVREYNIAFSKRTPGIDHLPPNDIEVYYNMYLTTSSYTIHLTENYWD